MNLILMIFGIVATFSAMVQVDRWFPKYGIICWMVFATITANILVCKSVDLLGFTCSLGNIMFASVFLSTDMINEKYGCELAKKGVMLCVVFQIIFVAAIQTGIMFTPSESDLVQDSMQQLFAINLRTSLSSICMFAISNFFGIWIHQKIKSKVNDKMWIRNNVSTMVANSLENFFFVFFAFWGLMDFETIISIALTTTVIECFIAACDTPFLYWAVKKEGETNGPTKKENRQANF